MLTADCENYHEWWHNYFSLKAENQETYAWIKEMESKQVTLWHCSRITIEKENHSKFCFCNKACYLDTV